MSQRRARGRRTRGDEGKRAGDDDDGNTPGTADPGDVRGDEARTAQRDQLTCQVTVRDPETLVLLLRSSDQRVIGTSAAALLAWLTAPDTPPIDHAALLELDLIAVLTNVLARAFIPRSAMQLTAELLAHETIRAAACDSDLFPRIVAVLTSCTAHSSNSASTAATPATAAASAPADAADPSAAAPAPPDAASAVTEPAALADVLAALIKAASGSSCTSRLCELDVPAILLIRLAASTTGSDSAAEPRSLLLQLLAACAADVLAVGVIRRSDGLPMLCEAIQRTSNDAADVKAHAMTAIARCVATDYECRGIVRQHGALSSCQDLLAVPQASSVAARTLAVLAQNQLNRDALVSARCVQALHAAVVAANTIDPTVAAAALPASSTETGDEDAPAGAAVSTSEADIARFADARADALHATLAALAELAVHPAAPRILGELGLAPILAQMQDPPARSDVVAAAVRAVNRCAGDYYNRSQLRSLDAFPLLQRLLNSRVPDAHVIEATAAITTLAANDMDIRSDLRRIGVPQDLVRLLVHDSVAEAAAAAAATAPTAALEHACRALAHLAHDADTRRRIVDAGGVAALLPHAACDTPALATNAMLALCSLAEDAATRAAIRNAGAIATANEQLAASLPEQRLQAIALLQACARDRLGAEHVCRQGALHRLLDVQRAEPKLFGQACGAAIETILTHNLSAKYWLRGQLDARDTTSDGVYDVPPIQAFASLDALSGQAPRVSGEILVADAERDAKLQQLVQLARSKLQGCAGEEEKLERLAQLVAAKLGGRMSTNQYESFAWQSDVNRCKHSSKSNVVPIGLVNRGAVHHRAFLLKYLADQLHVRVALHRGQHDSYRGCCSAWNTAGSSGKLVDVLTHPGRLLDPESSEGQAYRQL